MLEVSTRYPSSLVDDSYIVLVQYILVYIIIKIYLFISKIISESPKSIDCRTFGV